MFEVCNTQTCHVNWNIVCDDIIDYQDSGLYMTITKIIHVTESKNGYQLLCIIYRKMKIVTQQNYLYQAYDLKFAHYIKIVV